MIVRADLDRGVHAARGGAADQERQVEALALHLGRDMAHLVERGGDQARKPDDVDLLLARGFENPLCRHHHTEIGDLVIVALEHDADNVLADVVDIALDGGEQDLAGGLPLREPKLLLLLLHERHEISDGLLHHARGLHHLRQEHLAGAEKIADHVHALHQRAFDNVQRTCRFGARFLGVGLDVSADAVNQRMDQPLVHRLLAPREIDFALLRLTAFVAFGSLQQAVGRVGATVEDHVLDQGAQLRVDIVIERELASIHDAHVHARLDGVIEEHRMHRLAHAVVAAEGEGEIRYAARHVHVRELGLDAAGRVDIGACVVVMLIDAGSDGKDVGVEDDVFGREAEFLGKQIVGPLANLEFALGALGLALLVECHHHHRGTVAANFAGVIEERPLAFLQADGVHHCLALHAFQAGLDHRPFRGIDHDRHTGDVGLGGDQTQERGHSGFRVEHALVHVDVEHVGAQLDLLTRDFERGGVVVRLDQLAEAGGAGDIGPLAHHDEILRAVGH